MNAQAGSGRSLSLDVMLNMMAVVRFGAGYGSPSRAYVT